MTLYFILLFVGLALIVVGANFLTDGASALARKLKTSELMVGLTIVAVGTSAPELVVSVMSASTNNGDLAIGNIVGSNIFNALFILGLISLITEVKLNRRNIKRDITSVLVSTLILLVVLVLNNVGDLNDMGISRIGGIILLVCYIVYMYINISISRKEKNAKTTEAYVSSDSKPQMKVWLMVVMIIGGLVGLIYGGDMFLENVKLIAQSFGISNSVIAITIMAAGTSLPELASCVVAARKGKTQMALGNVIGSNVANIFLVLGVSATGTPIGIGSITLIDLGVLLLSSILLSVAAFSFKRFKIDRTEGVIFIFVYVAYMVYVVMR